MQHRFLRNKVVFLTVTVLLMGKPLIASEEDTNNSLSPDEQSPSSNLSTVDFATPLNDKKRILLGSFLRGYAGVSILTGVGQRSHGGVSKAIWGLHSERAFHGVSVSSRRINHYKVHQRDRASFRLEFESVGFEEEVHLNALIVNIGVEAGRIKAFHGDTTDRYSYRGASLGIGYGIFQNQHLHVGCTISGFYYLPDNRFETIMGSRNLRGLQLAFGINLNDSRSEPMIQATN